MFAKLDPGHVGRVGLAAFLAHRLRHFESLDADCDGRVTRAEFEARHPGLETAGEAASFERFDTNRDGAISREEWTAGETRRFRRIDTNHDGVVTRAEFLADRRRVCAARRGVTSTAGR